MFVFVSVLIKGLLSFPFLIFILRCSLVMCTQRYPFSHSSTPHPPPPSTNTLEFKPRTKSWSIENVPAYWYIHKWDGGANLSLKDHIEILRGILHHVYSFTSLCLVPPLLIAELQITCTCLHRVLIRLMRILKIKIFRFMDPKRILSSGHT